MLTARRRVREEIGKGVLKGPDLTGVSFVLSFPA